jgi:hypothetical protein
MRRRSVTAERMTFTKTKRTWAKKDVWMYLLENKWQQRKRVPPCEDSRASRVEPGQEVTVPTIDTFPEMTRVQLNPGEEPHSVVLYDDGVHVLWVAYVHSSTIEAGRGKAAGKTLADTAARRALAQHIKTKVSCRTCNDTGCYHCDG